LSEESYQKGAKVGRYRSFHKNGQPHWEGAFKEGDKHGLWKRYGENGQLVEEGYFMRGQRARSTWKYYDEDGNEQEMSDDC